MGTLQRLKREYGDPLSLAEKYYGLISEINNLKLTDRDVQLMAFMAVKGSISYANVRDEFCRRYNTSSPTVNNIISKLKKLRILTKVSGKIKLVPVLQLNFNNDVELEITLVFRQASEPVS